VPATTGSPSVPRLAGTAGSYALPHKISQVRCRHLLWALWKRTPTCSGASPAGFAKVQLGFAEFEPVDEEPHPVPAHGVHAALAEEFERRQGVIPPSFHRLVGVLAVGRYECHASTS
jgi:hypothetical protein